ncbi:histidine kinase [Saccharospirillum sp. MSK14-1]|uniref:CBS domain-containing protein n=1 Tax=Saccharospirillum sp. MSK14-1 TaxID=1897632 RepID=UPI000D3BEFB9|nr:CBS domain-containing protein [Saccharospirillum sp. MSK14-1]PTY36492.1 histidine kinase [Saccharospirillum sp. MSK14-1]
MKNMTLYPLSDINELAWPEQHESLSQNSPAVDFFTDFEAVQPRIIEVATSALDARKVMMTTHVRLLLVVNQLNHFVGVFSADDVIERKIVQRVSEGYRRDEIGVTDLMTPKKQLTALDITEVKRATIGNVIQVLKNVHQQHCLVIDSEHNRIRGIFSASDISRKLKLYIDTDNRFDFNKVFEVTA